MAASANPADLVRQFLSRFVVLTPEQAVACTMWVLHTWVFEVARATPYLVVMSPTKQSGKTRLLEVLELLVREPFRADSVTEAVVFRLIDQMQPTLLMDEVDAIFASMTERTEPLRAVLNSGNRAGGRVARCVPPQWDVKSFSVFCPKALAGIDNGRWPDTLLDRSTVVRLRRRLDAEEVEPFRYSQVEAEASFIKEELEAWASEDLDLLKDARPKIPDGLSDRAADAWEPLFAVADLLDGDWPLTVREAAVGLFDRQQDLEDTTAVAVLRDIRTVFEATGEAKLGSLVLCAKLRELPEAQWATWGGRRGKQGLTPNELAVLLRPFEVVPRVVRLSKTQERGSTVRGYAREDFEDAWKRYLGE